jgi:hypothetical protein
MLSFTFVAILSVEELTEEGHRIAKAQCITLDLKISTIFSLQRVIATGFPCHLYISPNKVLYKKWHGAVVYLS